MTVPQQLVLTPTAVNLQHVSDAYRVHQSVENESTSFYLMSVIVLFLSAGCSSSTHLSANCVWFINIMH